MPMLTTVSAAGFPKNKIEQNQLYMIFRIGYLSDA